MLPGFKTCRSKSGGKMRHFKLVLFVFSIFNLFFIHEAHAYINAGSGSYFIQIIIAVILGGIFALKLLWGKIKAIFKIFFKRK